MPSNERIKLRNPPATPLPVEFVGAKIRLVDGTITVNTGAEKNLSFDTEEYDTSDMWAIAKPERVYIIKDGYYLLTVKARYLDIGSIPNAYLRIYKNSLLSMIYEWEWSITPALGDWVLHFTTTAYLVVGDFLFATLWQNSGAPKVFGDCEITVSRLG